MALIPTYTKVGSGESTTGQYKTRILQISFVTAGSQTYATGGFAIAPTDVGVGHNLLGANLIAVIAITASHPIADVLYRADTGNLQLLDLSTGLEMANAQSLAATVIQVAFTGF